MEQAVVVLGSATPSLESYYNAQGENTASWNAGARRRQENAIVRVVDMRQVARHDKKNFIFSRS